MSASGITVSYEQMDAAASRLLAQRQTIDAELDRARALVDELVSGGFVTQHASRRFGAAAEQFVAGARQTMSGLDEMGGYLARAAQTLQQVDRDLAARIR